MQIFNKITALLFSTKAAGLYLLIFAAAIGVATFIENDFGTSAAQKLIFKARWFELLLALFGMCIAFNIYRFRMIQQKKWGTFTFHASILIILLGSAFTRYFGYEGMMHIREGDRSNIILSSDNHLELTANINGLNYQVTDPVLFASLGRNHYKRSYIFGSTPVDLELLEFVPNPAEALKDDPNGIPYLKLVIAGNQGREEYALAYNRPRNIHGVWYQFGDSTKEADVFFDYRNDSLWLRSSVALTQMVMATQTLDSIDAGVQVPLKLRSLYSSSKANFVVSEWNPKAAEDIVSTQRKMESSSSGALKLRLIADQISKEFYISGSNGVEGTQRKVIIGNHIFELSYGARKIELPFFIQLRDFIMDRYPGTNSASSYASEITLQDPVNSVERDFRIYMNNILDYGGHRFFQSSYDQDEAGTYLSVNKDALGTWVSYLGYILLTLGMILSLFDPNSRFRYLSDRIQSLRSNRNIVVTLLLSSSIATSSLKAAQHENIPLPVIDRAHADLFGALVVQDLNGRMKPMNTLTREVLRKLLRNDTYQNMNSDQVFLSMSAYPGIWNRIPLIAQGKHEKTRQILSATNDRLSYIDFFDEDGQYLLRDALMEANNKKPVDRGVFEKEIIKMDEKLNILNMVFSGTLLKLFPVDGHPNHHWEAPSGVHHQRVDSGAISFPDRFFATYTEQIQAAVQNGQWNELNALIQELTGYQIRLGGTIVPSSNQLKAEHLLNDLNVFSRLGKFYGLMGLIFLSMLFLTIFKPQWSSMRYTTWMLWLMVLGFAFQTFGLALRWYVSGRAPWSNGYESMIYIAWTTVLAGLLFSRKSLGGLTATTMLSAIVLMVAGMSWLDPEITPLVPVLKSYWLTIHVSLEAGSYGFLVLGALIGALNLLLMIFATETNKARMNRIIDEMSCTSEMTILGGLIMLSTGTYLGGVWANESWGRYWGWDAKETWALVSILVYSFILHMRLIPGLKGRFAYNTATLFGFASVMMTYFGVNYYLSGLHSYAAGDPVPIPTFVYYIFFGLVAISLIAYWKNRKLHII